MNFIGGIEAHRRPNTWTKPHDELAKESEFKLWSPTSGFELPVPNPKAGPRGSRAVLGSGR